MHTDDSDRSLSDGGTFSGETKPKPRDVSLGGEATFAGASKRRAAEVSLGDERTFGDRLDDQETMIDDIEVVDFESRYKPESTLGRGGMGEVLLALDTRLGRKVAIKRILGEAARSKTAVSRFLTEAKAIAAINHPNIVQIYDYGRAKDGPFLIMEYVDGSSLLDRCHAGALPLEEAVDLACQLCDGLAKAHDLGIVHRDIKPANVLLTKDGLPKLTDFGLAKAEAADHQMTMTGAVLGTPDFMPPEQRRDAALVDARSDLWSLAATLYQMVTGRSPKIIRFDLLPAALTQVLGKALEEAKDDRYQTARELRDALKVSLVAAVPAAAELGEGQCPACGVKNDSSRRFCRGCGESLETPCLSCTKPMPMWEDICGQCGTKQAPLLETRRGEMAARQAEAEGMLKDYDFEHAEQISVTLRDEADPRLKQLTAWATAFLPKIAVARDAQYAQAGMHLSEALKHEASFDYPSAIHALEQVPEVLRSRLLGDQAETVGAVLARVAAKQAEVERLESLIKARIAAKELGGLGAEVRKLRGLRPDRADVDKLYKQLEERHQKLVAQRDEAVRRAQSHLDAKDYESVIAVLRKVDRLVETPEVERLREAADVEVKYLQELMGEISSAVSQKHLSGLMPKVQTALSLRPGHPELLKLLDSLQAREAKVAAGVEDVVSQADDAFKACQFDKAATLLWRIPEDRRSREVTERLDHCEYLAMTKSKVLAGFEGLPKVSDLAEAESVDSASLAIQGRSYLGQIATHGFSDPTIEQLCAKFELAAKKREAAEQVERLAKANRRRIFMRVGAVIAVLAVVVVGLTVRSSRRAATIQSAMARGQLGAVLAIDPDNVPAILGLAKSKLAALPPDIDGAFAELDRAERIDGASAKLQTIRATAHMFRAIEHARGDRCAEAAQDLAKGIGLGTDPKAISIAQEAIAAAWLARAKKAVAKRDVDGVRAACDAARKAGARKERIAGIWREYGKDCVEGFDFTGLTTACTEAENYGMARAEVAHMWLRYGASAVKKRDVDGVRAACDAATKARAGEERIAGLWREYGKACVAGFDFAGLTMACTEAEKHGMAKAEVAAMWLRYGDSAVKKGDVDGVRAACDTATKAGVETEMVKPFRTKATILEAVKVFRGTESDKTVGMVSQAIADDEVTAVEMLLLPESSRLRKAVVQDCRKRFDSAVAAEQWHEAMVYVAATEQLDPQMESLLRSSLTAIPAEQLSRLLSAESIATLLTTEAIATLPPLLNSIGIKLKLLPPGEFTMGSGPQWEPHRVRLTKPFYIGVYEVTNAQWKSVMESAPSPWKEATRPVVNVNWEEAKEFCGKLSALPEERAAGRVYRLLTEAEWEYACRAGMQTGFSFGNEQKLLSDYGWFGGNSGKETHSVGQKKPNAWGLHDMHGNVWEWVSDWYGEEYRNGAETDPQGPFLARSRSCRGGSWDNDADYCRSGYRNWGDSPLRNHFLGFRLAMSPSEVKPPKESSQKPRFNNVSNNSFVVDMKPSGFKSGTREGHYSLDGRIPVDNSGAKIDHGPILVHGKASPKSFCVIAPTRSFSQLTFEVPQGCTEFQAGVAMADTSVGQRTPITFRILDENGDILWANAGSPLSNPGQQDSCRVSVQNTKTVTLRVECPGDWFNAHSIWVDPQFVKRAPEDADAVDPGGSRLIDGPSLDASDDLTRSSVVEAVRAKPPVINSIGLSLKLIPAGKLRAGNNRQEVETGARDVLIDKPLYFGVYEVTNSQWKRVMKEVPSRHKDDDFPVEMVTWDNAVEFCEILSSLPKEQRAGRRYRLPTEAEWEYACRAGTRTTYSFGDNGSRLGEYAWFNGNSNNQSHAVGQKKPNAWGLYDMHGNVWEWCSDSYSGGSVRANRGGGWQGGDFRSVGRELHKPTAYAGNLGFRVVMTLSEVQPASQDAEAPAVKSDD